MRIFDFDPDDHASHYREHRWVHVPGGMSDEFLAAARELVARAFDRSKVEGKAIAGAKQQALFEFPSGPDELFDVVAAVAGLERSTMTLAERHVKAYDHDAPPNPTPHKDRYASQCSVGLSIDVPADSCLVLYPYDHVSRNPFNVSAAYPRSLAPHELPEVALRGAREVVIDDAPGDVVMFPGSAVWHARRNPARTVNVYLKLNDFNCDPLGEDPSSPARRAATLAATALPAHQLDPLVAVFSRRFDTITRDADDVVHAHVWDVEPVRLTPAALELLRRTAERPRALGDLCDDKRAEALRLAAHGVIDLVPASSTAANGRGPAWDRTADVFGA